MRFLYFLVLVSLHSPAAASEEPRQWEHLFDNCGKSQQSPINILTSKATYKSDLKPFKFEKYDTEQDKKWTVRNNGHTVQVDLDGSAKIESGGLLGKYKAMQFHFHWGYNEGRGERSKASPGSEHSIDGERYAMELHIVHMKETFNDLNEALSKNGVAVLGFFIKVGKENRYYKPFISKLNNVTCKGNQTEMEALCLNALIPTNTDLTRFYRYNGSLTTPSCNEGVIWTLFETPIELSLQQIQEFWTKLYFGTTTEWPMMDNFRPTQPVGNRVVYKSDSNALLPAGNTLLLIPTATYLTLFLIQ